MMQEVLIRLFDKQSDGKLKDSGNEYELREFGGQIPSIGDFIVDPGVLSGLNRDDPLNRTVMKVVARYFQPGNSDEKRACIGLVVEERRGSKVEIDLLGP
jgi:hypothetical protein